MSGEPIWPRSRLSDFPSGELLVLHDMLNANLLRDFKRHEILACSTLFDALHASTVNLYE